MIDNAKRAGSVLFRATMRWQRCRLGTRELVVVAHSLGCRLVLEFLGCLRQEAAKAAGRAAEGGGPGQPAVFAVLPGLETLIIFLMAGAVPVGAIERRPDDVRVPRHIIVMHSAADRVLRGAFPLGQTFARGEQDWFPEAVGLRGLPSSARWTSAEDMADYDHGDYWPMVETARVVASYLSALLPGVTIDNQPRPERRLPCHELPARQFVSYRVRAEYG
jgi:hypothetical protein